MDCVITFEWLTGVLFGVGATLIALWVLERRR